MNPVFLASLVTQCEASPASHVRARRWNVASVLLVSSTLTTYQLVMHVKKATLAEIVNNVSTATSAIHW